MKTLVVYLCLIPVVILMTATGGLAAGELLSNCDFEEWSGGFPVGWIYEPTADPTLTQYSANTHSPQYCLQMTRNSGNPGIMQRAPITADEPYEFTLWAYCPAFNRCAIRLQFFNVPSGGTALATSDIRYNTLTNVWEQLTTGPVMAPAGATYAEVDIRNYTAGTVNLVDDASLQQVSRDQIDSLNGWSSEWDATAFNGGRRMVRDADGRFHMVFHSQASDALLPGNPPGAPSNRPCGIYYTYTLRPALDLPPPLQSGDWAPPTPILGTELDAVDDRYPSICINYDGTSPYINNDRLHIVWQREEADGGQYDICYATKLNEPSGIGGTWDGVRGIAFPLDYWLYQSLDRNSLVPVIDVTYNNVVHVAWQEEDEVYSTTNSEYYSEILYKNSGSILWMLMTGAVNVSQTTDSNSQTPSIAIAHDDRYTTSYVYPASPQDVIYIVWSDDVLNTVAAPYAAASSPHIYMRRSFDGGTTWDAFYDISNVSASNRDSYPNIAAEPWTVGSCDHVVWMSGGGTTTTVHDPDGKTRAGRGAYQPGVNPTDLFSFPGADPRMYGATAATRESIKYYSRGLFGASAGYTISTGSNRDFEFPTIATQGQGGPVSNDPGTRRLWVNYQCYFSTSTDYQILQDSATIDSALVGGAARWFGTADERISFDLTNDDFFPNLAFKKVAMYWPAGRSLPWIKINGHGAAAAATANAKPLWFSSSFEWEDPRPGDAESAWSLTHNPSTAAPTGYTMRSPLNPTISDATVLIFAGGNPMGTIYTPSNSTLYYRKMSVSNGTAWLSTPLSFFINESPNEYFSANINLAGLTPVVGDIIEYYLAVNTDLIDFSASDAESTQYIHAGDLKTRMEVVAQGHPFRFVVQSPPTETPTPESTATYTALPTSTSTPIPTNTPTLIPTNTALPTDTPTLVPTNTALPTSTSTPIPTNTPTLIPTNTALPTNTPTLVPTNTALPTNTSTPIPTNTPTLIPTNTALPTNTPTLVPTNTALPTNTSTPIPTNTALPTETPTIEPTNTSVPTDTPTAPPVPTLTATETPYGSTNTPTSTSSPMPVPATGPAGISFILAAFGILLILGRLSRS